MTVYRLSVSFSASLPLSRSLRLSVSLCGSFSMSQVASIEAGLFLKSRGKIRRTASGFSGRLRPASPDFRDGLWKGAFRVRLRDSKRVLYRTLRVPESEREREGEGPGVSMVHTHVTAWIHGAGFVFMAYLLWL